MFPRTPPFADSIWGYSHWKCKSGLIFVCLYVLLSWMLCFHVCTHVLKTFENKIPFQTLEKWHNVSDRFVSYFKSVTFNIWRTVAWFLKPFGETVEENHIYHLVKPNSAVKTRTVHKGCKVCYQVFLENWKIDFKSKIWKFNINFQT